MQPRIDVHLLTMDEPEQWRQDCIASLEGAPIQLHILPGIPGSIGQARAAGYRQGSLPLVSFVDPDDLYEASAFTQLADALDACPQAVMAYTDEDVIDESARHIVTRRLHYSRWQHAYTASHVHGLIVMRRTHLEAVLPRISAMNGGFDWALTLSLAARGGVLHLPIIGRHWRQHAGQIHHRLPLDARAIHDTIRS